MALTRFCVAKWDRSLAVSDVSRLVTSHSSLHSVHYMAPSVISWTACGTRARDRAPSTREQAACAGGRPKRKTDRGRVSRSWQSSTESRVWTGARTWGGRWSRQVAEGTA